MANTKNVKKQISKADYITDKVLSVFCICMCGMLLVMVLQRMIDHGSTYKAGMILQKILLGVGVVGVLGGIWKAVQERKSGRDYSRRLLRGSHIAVIGVVLTLMMTAIGLFGLRPVPFFYVMLPVLAVYYLVFHSYHTEFFLIAVDCGAAAVLVWVVYRAWISSNFGFAAYAALAAAVLLAAAQIIWIMMVQKNNGAMALPGRVKKLHFSRNAYTMLYVTPIVMIAIVAVAALVGMAATLYCFAAVGVYLFVTAVYYTVKLM